MKRTTSIVPGWNTLKTLWLIGAITALLCCFTAVAVSNAKKSWDGKASCFSRCKAQLSYRSDLIDKIDIELKAIKTRISTFKEALGNPNDKAFIPSRIELEHAIEREQLLKAELNKLEVSPVYPGIIWVVALLLTGSLVSFFVAKYVLFDAQKSFQNEISFKNRWKKPYFSIAGFLIGFTLIEQILASVMIVEKSWFSWDSFCISVPAFILMRLSYAANQFAIAYALTIIYLISDTYYVPKVRLFSPDGKCGVAKYVSFVQRWTIIGMTAAFIPMIFWLRHLLESQMEFKYIYLLTILSSLAVVFFLVLRGIRCGYELRNKYEKAKESEMGLSWSSELETKIPEDPTHEFIGDKWWKLPAAVSVVIGSAWLLIRYLGIERLILDLIN